MKTALAILALLALTAEGVKIQTPEVKLQDLYDQFEKDPAAAAGYNHEKEKDKVRRTGGTGDHDGPDDHDDYGPDDHGDGTGSSYGTGSHGSGTGSGDHYEDDGIDAEDGGVPDIDVSDGEGCDVGTRSVRDSEGNPIEELGPDCVEIGAIRKYIREFNEESRAAYRDARKELYGNGDEGASATDKKERMDAKNAAQSKHDVYKERNQEYNRDAGRRAALEQFDVAEERADAAIRKAATKPLRTHGMRILNAMKRQSTLDGRREDKALDTYTQTVLKLERKKKKQANDLIRTQNKEMNKGAKAQANARYKLWKDDVSKFERFCLGHNSEGCATAQVDSWQNVCKVSNGRCNVNNDFITSYFSQGISGEGEPWAEHWPTVGGEESGEPGPGSEK